MDKINFILDNIPDAYNKDAEGNVYKILNPIAKRLDEFLVNLDEVKKAKWVDYAKGEDLDKIGNILNMKRFNNESDNSYRGRIKARVPSFIGGGTISAIKQVITGYLGVEPVIIEHYKSGEGHPYFDKGVLKGIEVEKIDDLNLKVKSGIAYLGGKQYILGEITIPNNNGYLKYNLIPAGTKKIDNFAGKVAGSTVENPHTFKFISNAILQSPSSFSIEASQSHIDAVKTLGGTFSSSGTIVNGNSIQALFSFNLIEEIERNIGKIPASTLDGKIAWLKANIAKITANWHGWGTNKHANPMYKADFTGKVAGSVTENPHVAKYILSGTPSTTLQPPTSGNASEATNTHYGLIPTLNGSSFSASRSGSSEMAQQVFSFNLIEHVQRKYSFTIPGADTAAKVTWLKANIKQLKLYWHGKGSGPSGNKATISRFRSSWTNNSSGFQHTNNTITMLTAIENTMEGFIQSDGFVHFLAYAEASNGTIASTIETDFVELEVELVGVDKASFALWNRNPSSGPPAWGLINTTGNSTVTKISSGGIIDSANGWMTTGADGKGAKAFDENGIIHFLAYAEPSNGLAASTINTDYAELEIELKEVSPYLTNDADNIERSNQILLGEVNGTIIDNRTILNPEEHYITNNSSITIQIPYEFNTSNISLEDVKDILRNTKAAGIALLIKTMQTYNDSIEFSDSANATFLMGFSGIGSNNFLGGI